MKKPLIALILLTLCLPFTGCRRFHPRPESVPSSAVWVDGNFVECTVVNEGDRYRCSIYKDTSGEILADGLFRLDHPSAAPGKARLPYADYRAVYIDRVIVLEDARTLSLEEASERDPTNRLINDKLKSLSSSGRVPPTDCGETTTTRPDGRVSECAKAAFENRKPFHARYSYPDQIPYFSYGLAGDDGGNVFEVVYDIRGLVNLGMHKNSRAFDNNQVRVTSCMKPISLEKTEEGMLVCVTPINEEGSAIAAQQKPIEATVCAIVENPATFNNKMVRVRGHVSGNFEYSLLGGDGCSGSIWFTYGNGSGPPGLAAYVVGQAAPGGEDLEGRRILPIPVKLVEDSSFRRFQKLMNARVNADARSRKSKPDEFVEHRVTATFIGRIDGVSADAHAFHLKRSPTDRADYLGFGQMGLFDAQLVVESVEDDAVLDIESPPSNSP